LPEFVKALSYVKKMSFKQGAILVHLLFLFSSHPPKTSDLLSMAIQNSLNPVTFGANMEHRDSEDQYRYNSVKEKPGA